MLTPKILVAGQFNADVIVKPVEELPSPGLLKYVTNIEVHLGGCGLNTALVLHKLGMRVLPLAKIGSDNFGELILKKLIQNGIDSKGIKCDKKVQTSSVVVLISSEGERTFLYCPGSNEATEIGDISLNHFKEAKILHVGGIMKMNSIFLHVLFEKAKKYGLTTSADTDWINTNNWLDHIKPALEHLDIFMPSLEEAQHICQLHSPPEIAEFFLNYGIKIVVLKMGSKGCYVKTKEKEFTIPIYPVEKVIDSTGAGDAYDAGFLAGYLRGMDVCDCASLGNACGSLCVTRFGATEGITNWCQIEELINNNSIRSKYN